MLSSLPSAISHYGSILAHLNLMFSKYLFIMQLTIIIVLWEMKVKYLNIVSVAFLGYIPWLRLQYSHQWARALKTSRFEIIPLFIVEYTSLSVGHKSKMRFLMALGLYTDISPERTVRTLTFQRIWIVTTVSTIIFLWSDWSCIKKERR